MKRTIAALSLLALVAMLSGCYTVQKMPMRSEREQEIYRPKIERAIGDAKVALHVADNPVEAIEGLRQVSLDGCPEDYAAAFRQFCDACTWRLTSGERTWIRTAAGTYLFGDDSPVKDAAAQLRLVAKSYGANFSN